ncbi:MAG: helix-turn-helix transcriptional regulator [Minwuia sp.]|uniref:helix-turn-helix transcriptional regulator n=1 Tax=Minwuia sp. TaxID=2493630 RepID=UPI003A8946EA
MAFELLSIREVGTLLGVSRASIYRWIRDDGFPKPVKLGASRSVWLLEEIETWVMARAGERMEPDASTAHAGKDTSLP